MVKTYESRFPSSSDFDKVTISFGKLNYTDLFLQIHGIYILSYYWTITGMDQEPSIYYSKVYLPLHIFNCYLHNNS